jgi:hypothetical protein
VVDCKNAWSGKLKKNPVLVKKKTVR